MEENTKDTLVLRKTMQDERYSTLQLVVAPIAQLVTSKPSDTLGREFESRYFEFFFTKKKKKKRKSPTSGERSKERPNPSREKRKASPAEVK